MCRATLPCSAHYSEMCQCESCRPKSMFRKYGTPAAARNLTTCAFLVNRFVQSHVGLALVYRSPWRAFRADQYIVTLHVTSLEPLKRRVPVGPHRWTGCRSLNRCLQAIKKVIMLPLREQHRLAHTVSGLSTVSFAKVLPTSNGLAATSRGKASMPTSPEIGAHKACVAATWARPRQVSR